MAHSEPESTRLFAPPAPEVMRRRDGVTLLRSRHALEPHARCMGAYLVQWAEYAPTRRWLAERAGDGSWRGVTYAEALEQVYRLGTGLLEQNLSPERPVVVLSEN